MREDSNKRTDALYSDILAREARLRYGDTIISRYRNGIKRDLEEKLGISIEKLGDMTVMDVGSGAQSVAFHSIGARQVHHFDIGANQVESLNAYIRENGISNVTSRNLDVVENEIKDCQFDLIYLSGVYHHFTKPSKFLVDKVLNNLKDDGYVYFMYYRSGSFGRFIFDFLRKIVKPEFYEKVDKLLQLNFRLTLEPKKIIQILDDFFVPNIHLFSPAMFVRDAERVGMKAIYSSEPISDDIHEYDHSDFGQFSYIVFKKTHSISGVPKPEELYTWRGLDQLDDIQYNEGWIAKSAELIREFVNYAQHDVDDYLLLTTMINLARSAWPLYKCDFYNPDHLIDYVRKMDDLHVVSSDLHIDAFHPLIENLSEFQQSHANRARGKVRHLLLQEMLKKVKNVLCAS